MSDDKGILEITKEKLIDTKDAVADTIDNFKDKLFGTKHEGSANMEIPPNKMGDTMGAANEPIKNVYTTETTYRAHGVVNNKNKIMWKMDMKKFLKLENFLCFFDLESCGIIIGALGILFVGINLIATIVLLCCVIFIKDFCFQQHFPDLYIIRDIFSRGFPNDLDDFNFLTQNNSEDSDLSCTEFRKIFVGLVLVGTIILNIISIVAHYRIIKGVEEYNSARFSLPQFYYKIFIVIEIISLIFLIVWSFFSIKMILAALLFFIALVTDIYNYIVIEKLRIKYLSQPSISLVFAPENIKKPKKKKLSRDEKNAKRIEAKNEKNENFCYVFEHKPETDNYYKPLDEDKTDNKNNNVKFDSTVHIV